MKRIFGLLLLTAILTSLCCLFGACQAAENQEASAEDFEYQISPEKDRIIITKYVGTATRVVIPAKIEGLPVFTIKGYDSEEGKAVGAFQNSDVQSVVIPGTVRVIIDAFADCKKLKEVKFSDGSMLTMISGAFKNCTSLEKIDFSSTNITEIEADSFDGCTALKEIIFTDSIKEIGKRAFRSCTSLEEIVLPKKLISLGELAFEGCSSLKRITVPATLNMKSNGDTPVFRGLSSLEQIVFEEGRKELSSNAFAVIDTDAEIIIPKSVKSFSCSTIDFKRSARLVFLGDCPEILDAKDGFDGEAPTVYYDPATKGWEDCVWKENYTVIPKQ